MSDEDVQRITRLLDRAIRDSRITKKSIEQRMGWSAGYMTRLMRGAIELKLRHIFDVAQLIDLDLPQFFRNAFPPGGAVPGTATPGSAAGAAESAASTARPGLRIAVLTEEELSQRIEGALERFLARQQGEAGEEGETAAAEPPPAEAVAPPVALRAGRRSHRAG